MLFGERMGWDGIRPRRTMAVKGWGEKRGGCNVENGGGFGGWEVE